MAYFTHSSCFAVVSSSFILVVSSSFVPTYSVFAAAEADTTRITAAANVTLRAMPVADATAVAQLPLGTELVDAGPAGLDKTWVRVRLPDQREGWLVASMTRPLDPVWRWPTFDRIIADRLGRKGDSFPAAIELVSFIERVAPEYTDPDGRGRIELARLRALAAAAGAIPRNGQRREPYASWLTSRKNDVIYDEPGGRWLVSGSAIWDVHLRQAATTSADDIAWFAVTTGMPSDCEGHVTCYLDAHNRLHGEYLRRQPLGKRAADAVGTIRTTAEMLAAPARTAGAAYRLDKKRDCGDLNSSVDTLSAAVKGTRVGDRDAAMASLAALRQYCR